VFGGNAAHNFAPDFQDPRITSMQNSFWRINAIQTFFYVLFELKEQVANDAFFKIRKPFLDDFE
jgi:hypothetical protein